MHRHRGHPALRYIPLCLMLIHLRSAYVCNTYFEHIPIVPFQRRPNWPLHRVSVWDEEQLVDIWHRGGFVLSLLVAQRQYNKQKIVKALDEHSQVLPVVTPRMKVRTRARNH